MTDSMTTINLGITDAYCPDWGVAEGVREFVQNALDAHDRGMPMSITYSNGVCRIANAGARVPISSWLLGVGDKTGDNGQRGGFCEGMAIGALALLRAGVKIEISQPGTVWRPCLWLDPQVGRSVLTIYQYVTDSAPDTPYLVTLTGVDRQQMLEVQRRFIALRKVKPGAIKHEGGKILIDESEKGNVYVKGIFVGHLEGLQYGYDFWKGVKTDRDRKMADRHQMDVAMCEAWSSVCMSDPRAIDLVVCLMDDSVDLQWARLSWTLRKPGGVIDQLHKRFIETHGDDAFPVRSEGDRESVGHYGIVGVMLPPRHVDLLEIKMGTLKEAIGRASETVMETFATEQLEGEGKEALDTALGLIEPVAARLGYDPVRPRVQLVRFSGECQGQYLAGGKIIVVAHRLLSDPIELLATIVHEMCHEKGGDGTIQFDRAQARVLAEIVMSLVKKDA